MKKALIVILVLAGLMTLAMAGLYQYWLSVPSVPVASPAAEPDSPAPGFSFTALKEPRPLPEIPFIHGDGHTLSLADFRGKVVLLNIWATWCVPCQEEMPALDRLQAMLGGPDFEVVALAVDRQGLAAVKDFYKEFGLEALAVFVDPSGGAPLALNLFGIPTTLLIDREGREIGRTLGTAVWDSAEVVAVIRRHLDTARQRS